MMKTNTTILPSKFDGKPRCLKASERLRFGACALAVGAMLAAHSAPVSAATTFTGSAGGDVTNAGNWDNGLPTGGNVGTIDKQVNWPNSSATLTDYHLDITTNGKLDRLQFMTVHTMDGGVWTVSGGAIETRALRLENAASLTLETGTIDVADNGGDDLIVNASTLTVNGGTLNVADKLAMNNAASIFEMNGGVVSAKGVGGIFGSQGTYNFNAGALAADSYSDLGSNSTTIQFGSGLGTVAFGSYSGNNTVMDWDAASGFELTITGADSSFYEGLWNAGGLLIDGSNAGTFASSDFVVNGSTLSIVPEPGSLALLGLGGLCVLRRRRSI